MPQILIVLGSKSDMTVTQSGVALLKEFKISFSLRIASAHRSPEHLEKALVEFNKNQGKVVIAVAGKSAHLAGVVAARTVRPVIAVPIHSEATAGFDALLSMSQMPAGVPVATMGFGASGFDNACLLAMQILALENAALATKLTEHRSKQTQRIVADDEQSRIDFS